MTTTTALSRKPVEQRSYAVRLLEGTLFNYAGTLGTGLLQLLLVPLVLRGAGTEQYGIWVAALYASGFLAAPELGLGISVVRYAAAEQSGMLARVRRLVTWLGLAGLLVLLAVAYPASTHLHLTARMTRTSIAVFAWSAVAFPFERWISYRQAIWEGQQRFALVNAFNVLLTAVRFVGVGVLMLLHRSIAWVAALYACTAAVAALALAIAQRGTPPASPPASDGSLLDVLRHTTLTQLAATAGALSWQVAPLMLGFTRGASAVAFFNIGQKIPMVLVPFYQRTADVALPLAGEQSRRGDRAASRRLMTLSCEMAWLVMLPASILLWVFAPVILRLWIGVQDPTTVLIARFCLAALLADSIASVALQFVWGWGALRQALNASLAALVVASVSATIAIPWFGGAGAAFALSLAMLFSAALLVRAASKGLGTSAWTIFERIRRALPLPVVVTLVPAVLVARYAPPASWWELAVVCTACALLYILVFFFLTAHPQDRLALRALLSRRIFSAEAGAS